MSVQSEINRLKQAVSSAYTAIGNKGGTVPNSKVISNIAGAINSIPKGFELYFTVFNFETLDKLLASTPPNNSIGIVSSTFPTTKIFSQEEPTSPYNGCVWIITGEESQAPFDIFKENTSTNVIMVYPKFVKQYIDGQWVDVTAKIFQNGNWIDLATEFVIFESGKGALVTLNKYRESSATITVGTEFIEITYSSTQANYVTSLRTAEVIDMAKYSKLSMEFIATKRISASFDSFGVTSTAFTKADPPTLLWIAKTDITASAERQTITVDLSAVNESVYVALLFGGAMSITRIWLE